MISEYPKACECRAFPEDAEKMTKIIDAIKAIRTRRSEMNVPPSKKAKVYLATKYQDVFSTSEAFFVRLASASELIVSDAFAGVAHQILGAFRLRIEAVSPFKIIGVRLPVLVMAGVNLAALPENLKNLRFDTICRHHGARVERRQIPRKARVLCHEFLVSRDAGGHVEYHIFAKIVLCLRGIKRIGEIYIHRVMTEQKYVFILHDRSFLRGYFPKIS